MRFLRPASGFILSGVAVVVLFRGTDWAAVRAALAEANVLLIAATLPLLLLLMLVRAFRWCQFFPDAPGITAWRAFKSLNIGYMVGNILPLQMGELARVYALGEQSRVSKARILATVAVERVFDVALLLVGALLLGPFIELPKLAAYALGSVVILLLVAVGGLVIAAFSRSLAERLTDPLILLMPARVERSLLRVRGSMLDGLAVLSDARQVFLIISWTALSWVMSAAMIYVLLRALHIDVPLTAAPFLLIATTLAFLLPSSPGAIGVYDAVVVTSLVTAFGVDRDQATSFALVAHACYAIPPTILGAYFWWSMSLRIPADPAGNWSSPSIGPRDEDATVPSGEPVVPT